MNRNRCNHLRAFLAFEIEEKVMEKLLEAERELKQTGADVKIVERASLHFTVRFFGEIADAAVDDIDRAIRAINLRGLDVDVRGIGVFPDLRRPRVIWAGVAGDGGTRLADLARVIIAAVNHIGKPENHEYHPHITLARVRSPRNKDALTAFVTHHSKTEFGVTVIGSLKLKSSVLTPNGPIYSDIREYALK